MGIKNQTSSTFYGPVIAQDQICHTLHNIRCHMPCLIGAITFFNQTKGEQSCWASLIKDISFHNMCAKIDVWLN